MKKQDVKISAEVLRYADALYESGMDEREVARAYLYAGTYGLSAVADAEGCVTFKEPSCCDWNCLNPEHQRLVKA